MDESMEASASMNGAFGMRVFDAGEFHVGFGIVVPSDDETTEFSVEGICAARIISTGPVAEENDCA